MNEKGLRTLTVALVLLSMVLASVPFTPEVEALKYGANTNLGNADASFLGETSGNINER
jgi:hypothetical protein